MSLPDLTDSLVLIVDDEEANVDLLTGCLEEAGYSRFVATTRSAEAMALFQEQRPDLVLLDLHMPEPNGFTLLENFRRSTGPDQYLPILILTADVTEPTKQRALEAGANDFLTKPFDISEVTLRIRNLLHTRYLHEAQRLGRRAAEASERRAMSLAAASEVLATSLDHHSTLSMLCRSLVPGVADGCLVDLVQADGRVAREGVAHADPTKESLLSRLIYENPHALPPQHPLRAAICDGNRTLLSQITAEMIEDVTPEKEHLEALRSLRPNSMLVVPIAAPASVYGALILYRSVGRDPFDEDDLDFAADVARRAAMTLENARLFDGALQATRARDEMLGIVAHDLRNPLSTIVMGSSMLLDGAGEEMVHKYADMVHRAAGRMQTLIEDLLEVRRIETGKLKVEPRIGEVSALMAEALTMLGPLAQSREIDMTADVAEDVSTACFDAARLLQVISNLVGNALKFTPAGGHIQIGCRLDGEEVVFSVADDGPGIPREQIPHIFGRFWQAGDNDVRGIGLGLSIVKGIVQAHGGRVWVESVFGSGSTFLFTVPRHAAVPLEPQDLLAVQTTGEIV